MTPNEQVKPPRKNSTLAQLIMVGLVGGQMMACMPIVDQRGYVFNQEIVSRLEIGKTTFDQSKNLLGSPTTYSNFNGGAAYYIHSRFISERYRAPKEVERTVLALYFDGNEVIRDIGVYGLEDGVVVPIVARTTDTMGLELSIIGQLLSNVGRLGDGSTIGGDL